MIWKRIETRGDFLFYLFVIRSPIIMEKEWKEIDGILLYKRIVESIVYLFKGVKRDVKYWKINCNIIYVALSLSFSIIFMKIITSVCMIGA